MKYNLWNEFKIELIFKWPHWHVYYFSSEFLVTTRKSAPSNNSDESDSALGGGTWTLMQLQNLQGKFIWKNSTVSYHVLLMVAKYKLDVQTVRIQNSQQQYDQKQIWDIFIGASTICRHESNFETYMNFKLNTHIYRCMCVCVCVYIYIYFLHDANVVDFWQR